MAGEDEQSQSGYDDANGTGPGAPTPLSSLEASPSQRVLANVVILILEQGINGITARDIKLFVDGGYNTVESIAYTYERNILSAELCG
jgi:hypothetical protein